MAFHLGDAGSACLDYLGISPICRVIESRLKLHCFKGINHMIAAVVSSNTQACSSKLNRDSFFLISSVHSLSFQMDREKENALLLSMLLSKSDNT